jgi:hypothetical protein
VLQVTLPSNVDSFFFDYQTKVGLCRLQPRDTVSRISDHG